MHRMRSSFWFTIVLMVFLILILTVALMVPVAFIAVKIGLLEFVGQIRVMPLVCVALISVFIGTLISAMASSSLLEPIKKLRAATKEVAKGNFDVQIENDKENEVGDLIQDFNVMVRDLGSLETLRNDFITNVSHEFKTPIASIEGCAVLLQDESLTAKERTEYAKLIADSAHGLSILTTNILRLSKLENQEIIPEQQEISLDEQLRQCILMLEPKWSEKNIDLDIELDKVTLFTNAEMLSHVWLNLIGNAIKFSYEGGLIRIFLSDDDENIVVSVKDEGIGMSEEVQKHIFDKFYQGDKTHSSDGNGLGLPLVKRILDLCGGRVEVESELKKGSTFTVYFPKFVVIPKQKKLSGKKTES